MNIMRGRMTRTVHTTRNTITPQSQKYRPKVTAWTRTSGPARPSYVG